MNSSNRPSLQERQPAQGLRLELVSVPRKSHPCLRKEQELLPPLLVVAKVLTAVVANA